MDFKDKSWVLYRNRAKVLGNEFNIMHIEQGVTFASFCILGNVYENILFTLCCCYLINIKIFKTVEKQKQLLRKFNCYHFGYCKFLLLVCGRSAYSCLLHFNYIAQQWHIHFNVQPGCDTVYLFQKLHS